MAFTDRYFVTFFYGVLRDGFMCEDSDQPTLRRAKAWVRARLRKEPPAKARHMFAFVQKEVGGYRFTCAFGRLEGARLTWRTVVPSAS
jgi:hypothetical protein